MKMIDIDRQTGRMRDYNQAVVDSYIVNALGRSLMALRSGKGRQHEDFRKLQQTLLFACVTEEAATDKKLARSIARRIGLTQSDSSVKIREAAVAHGEAVKGFPKFPIPGSASVSWS